MHRLGLGIFSLPKELGVAASAACSKQRIDIVAGLVPHPTGVLYENEVGIALTPENNAKARTARQRRPLVLIAAKPFSGIARVACN